MSNQEDDFGLDPELAKFRVSAELREECTIQWETDLKRGITTSHTWENVRLLGRGSFGQVRQEKRKDDQGDWHYRAVKVCSISRLRQVGVDCTRELSALAALSSSKHYGLFVNLAAWWTNGVNLCLAMEYVSNGDLSHVINADLEEEDAKEIMTDILNGLEVLHFHGITHRDIKPQNVLVVRKRPQFAKWWVKIGDFGISKSILEGSATSLRSTLGTRPYCAPEILGYLKQYQETSVYDNKVDVWSVGCVLFNMGAHGRMAFTDPDLVRYCDGTLPFSRLETPLFFSKAATSLIAEMLHPDPKSRPSASDAIQHPWFASGTAISQPRIPPPSNKDSGQYQNYNSFLSSSSIMQASHGTKAESISRLEHPLHSKSIGQVATNDSTTGASSFKTTRLLPDETEHQQMKSWTSKLTMKGHKAWVNAVAISPSGQLVASASGAHFSARIFYSTDDTVRLWDIATGACEHVLSGHTNAVVAVAFSPDSQAVVSGSYDNTVRIWDARRGVQLRIMMGHTGKITAVSWSSNNLLIASGSTDGTIKLWNTSNGVDLHTFSDRGSSVSCLAFSHDSKKLVSGLIWHESITVWDVATAQPVTKVVCPTSAPSVAFSPDSKLFVSAGLEGMYIWNTESGLQEHCLLEKSPTDSVAWSPNGKLIASGSNDLTVRLWDSTKASFLVELSQELKDINLASIINTVADINTTVSAVAFSPDSKIIASGSEGNMVTLWDLKTQDLPSRYL